MLLKLKKLWGNALITVTHMGMFITLINLCLLIVTAYNTNWFQAHGLNVNIVGFAAIIFGLLIIGVIIVTKVNIPSFFSSWNDRFWGNENPIKLKLEDMEKRMITKEDLETLITELRRQYENR